MPFIPHTEDEVRQMLEAIGVSDIDATTALEVVGGSVVVLYLAALWLLRRGTGIKS